MSGFMSARLDDLDPSRHFWLGDARSPDALAAGLRRWIRGQDHAVDAVVRALTIAAVGIRNPDRPIASLLFVGPTGVGKTELARQLAHHVRGDADGLCRIDMNSLAQEHYAASLSGAPPGYAGAKEQYTLFERDKIEGSISRPGVVLFDEVEKAHPTVLRSLLQILDTGILRLAAGNSTIDFRNAVVVLTSNLGTREAADLRRPWRERTPPELARWVRDRALHPHRTESDVVTAAVREFFDPELLNRFDEVIAFRSIDRPIARSIVDTEIDQLIATLSSRNILCEVTSEARELLADKGFDARFGARELHRTLRRELHAPIAGLLVRRGRESAEPVIAVTAADDHLLVTDDSTRRP